MRASKPKFQVSQTDFTKLRIAIVHATWNSEFNSEMAKAAREVLESRGITNIDTYEIPGAFEMPVFCKRLTQIGAYYKTSGIGLGQGLCERGAAVDIRVNEDAERANNAEISQSGLSCQSKYDAILCYATVIRGETAHFDLVANESTRGIMQVATDTGIPVLNGILACENEAQASTRASIAHENKGAEVALSALALLHELSKIK